MTHISGDCLCGAAGMPTGSIQLISGKSAACHDTGSSGQPVYRHLCAACGSAIFSDVVATPQLDWLKAGTLDDTSGVKPAANIWCASARSRVAYPEGVPRLPQNPPSARPAARAPRLRASGTNPS